MQHMRGQLRRPCRLIVWVIAHRRGEFPRHAGADLGQALGIGAKEIQHRLLYGKGVATTPVAVILLWVPSQHASDDHPDCIIEDGLRIRWYPQRVETAADKRGEVATDSGGKDVRISVILIRS